MFERVRAAARASGTPRPKPSPCSSYNSVSEMDAELEDDDTPLRKGLTPKNARCSSYNSVSEMGGEMNEDESLPRAVLRYREGVGVKGNKNVKLPKCSSYNSVSEMGGETGEDDTPQRPASRGSKTVKLFCSDTSEQPVLNSSPGLINAFSSSNLVAITTGTNARLEDKW